MALSTNRDLENAPSADIPHSRQDMDLLKDFRNPNIEGQMAELHSSLKKYKSYGKKI